MSNEIDKRLIGCFQAVFPDLSEDNIPSASQESVPAWDSVAAITLINVIEEEFGIELDLDHVTEFDSFTHLRSHVRSQVKDS